MSCPVSLPSRSWMVALLLGLIPTTAVAQSDDYIASQHAWRAEREASLIADDGWLTIAALHFLRNGENSFGASPLNDLVVPEGPMHAGVFELRQGEVLVRATEGQTLTVDGRPITDAQLYPASDPDEGRTVRIGDVTLWVHHSGDRLAIRVRNPNSDLRKQFTGRKWFNVDPRYRVRARFTPHDAPMVVRLPNVLGDVELFTSHGTVGLTVNGQEMTLLPVTSDDRLWFIFRDLTSGTDTYSAARFLYANPPDKDGWTIIDFNQAYNPPCAFNPHTTCPLPPQPNRLPMRIEAGEKKYH